MGANFGIAGLDWQNRVNWDRLKPSLRHAVLCGDGRPLPFEQGGIGFQIERSPSN